MGFLDSQVTHQPYFKIEVGEMGGKGTIKNKVDATRALDKMLQDVTITRQLKKATKMSATFSFGVTDELQDTVDPKQTPYFFFGRSTSANKIDKFTPGMEVTAGYYNLGPLDRTVKLVQYTKSLGVIKGAPLQGLIQSDALAFRGGMKPPSVTGGQNGELTFRVEGVLSSATKGSAAGGGLDRLKQTLKGKIRRGGAIKNTPSANTERLSGLTGIQVLGKISSMMETIFPSDDPVYSDTTLDAVTSSKMLASYFILPDDMPMMEPSFFEFIESRLDFLNRFCDHYGLDYAEHPVDDANTFIFFPRDPSSLLTALKLSTGEHEGILAPYPGLLTAMDLRFGEAVTNFNYTHNAVTAQGGSFTATLPSGETYQLKIDNAAIKRAVKDQFGEIPGTSKLGAGVDVARHFFNLAKTNESAFINMFTAVVLNVKDKTAVTKANSIGTSGLTLKLDLKWGIPGLKPGGLIHFAQPAEVGQKVDLIPAPVQGLYRVVKVVDKFNATSNIFTQSLTCKK